MAVILFKRTCKITQKTHAKFSKKYTIFVVLMRISQKEVEYQKRIAQRREEIAHIGTPNRLRINKSVKYSSFRMYH